VANQTGHIYVNIGNTGLNMPDDDLYYQSGQCACDSNGDVYAAFNASGSDTMDVWFKPHAVQLR